MVTIIGWFALFSGLVASYAYASNKYYTIKSISYFILGLVILLLSGAHFSGTETPQALPYALISVLAVSFFIGEISKNKVGLIWNVIPLLLAITVAFLVPNLTNISYMDFQIESREEVLLVAVLSAITPFLTHLAKLGIGNLVIRFGTIKWAENEENYLESLVSYAFIGGVAALGSFLIGQLGLLIAGTFYLSASLIARNKLGLKNKIILSASGALFLVTFVPIFLSLGSFTSLDFTRGEVLQGAFFAGFLVVSHHLFILLARFNTGKWMFILSGLAMLIPVVAIVALGMAYTQSERLGGVLSIAALYVAMGILSVTFSLFKDASFVSLKLIAIGTGILLLPLIKPVEQVSTIDYEALGISEEAGEAAPKGKSLTEAIGEWEIKPSASKVYFELGPPNGRTKGEFKSINGNIVISESVEKSLFEVVMPLSELTTYISPRDKELMGDGYFNAEKYPSITYKANTLKQDGDAYELQGEFTMMGVTKSLPVTLKLLAIAENEGEKALVFIGTSQLDRTDFGMSPSAKIGNVVDFNFEVQCIEK